MGIEDQSTQAYQTIGQAPSAPQLAPQPPQQGIGQLPFAPQVPQIPQQGIGLIGGQIAMKKGGEVTNHKHPLAHMAEDLASYGRDGDSELLHVTKDEIKGLLAAAAERGIHMTRNPHTGIYEASWLSKAWKKVKNKVGPVFTKLRDVAQSVAVVAGNTLIPGSSMLTSRLASKGSQKMLNSGLGQIAQFATSLGTGGGGGLSGIFKGGIKNLGSNLMKGASNIGSKLTGMFRGAGGLLNGLRTGQFTIGDVLKSTGNLIKGKFYNTAVKGVMGLQNLGTSIKGGLTNLLNNPMGTLKNWGSKGLEFLKNRGTDVKNLLGKVLGGGQQGEGGGVDWGNLLGGAAAGYFGSQAGGGDGGGGAGAPGGAPGASFYNTSFKRVLNPNYGKPGEPFYLTQEFGPSEFSNQYKEGTAQDLKVTDQGLQPNDPAAVQAAAAQQAQAAQSAAPTSAQDFTFNVPVQAAHGGLMHGYADGGALPYSGGGNTYEYAAGGKLLDGPGDGMSDSIPAEIRGKKVQKALLADGEFVIPADVVSGLGNGSTKAGSKVLYNMMARVREARTGTPEQGKQIDPNKFVPA